MKKTVVVYGSSTGTCEAIANTIAEKLGVEAINVSDFNADVVAENDNLILGTSTWGAGELQDDWYDGINVLKEADLSGKTVAIFGCGDAESYSDTFCGGMKEIMTLHKVLTSSQVYQQRVIHSMIARLLLMVSLLVLHWMMLTRMTKLKVVSMHG